MRAISSRACSTVAFGREAREHLGHAVRRGPVTIVALRWCGLVTMLTKTSVRSRIERRELRDADDGGDLPVDAHRAADDARVAAEMVHPELVCENGNGAATAPSSPSIRHAAERRARGP